MASKVPVPKFRVRITDGDELLIPKSYILAVMVFAGVPAGIVAAAMSLL